MTVAQPNQQLDSVVQLSVNENRKSVKRRSDFGEHKGTAGEGQIYDCEADTLQRLDSDIVAAVLISNDPLRMANRDLVIQRRKDQKRQHGGRQRAKDQ